MYKRRFITLAAVTLAASAACSQAMRPIEVTRSTNIVSNGTPEETAPVLRAAEDGLTTMLQAAAHLPGGMRRARLTDVRVEGPVALIDGCGTFYDYLIPDRYAILLVAVPDGKAWRLHSWEVARESFHGPPLPCR